MRRQMNMAETVMCKRAVDNGGWRVGIMLTLKGPAVSEQGLHTVLHLAQERHPILRTKINVKKSGNVSWEEDLELRIPVLKTASKDITAVYKEALKRPLRDGNGLFRVILSEDVEEITDDGSLITNIIFLCDHCGCDGISFNLVVNEIMLGLSDINTLKHLPKLPASEGVEAIGRKVIGNISIGSTYRFIKSLYRFTTAFFPGGAEFPLSQRVGRPQLSKKCSQIYSTQKMSQQKTKDLLNRCRENNTTLTGVIGSAVADSMSELVQAYSNNKNSPQKVTVMCAIDARSHYTPILEPNHLGFHVTATVPTPLNASGRGDTNEMWTNAKDYRDGITESINNSDQRIVLPHVGAFIAGLHRLPSISGLGATGQPSAYFTNWGRLPYQSNYGEKWEVLKVYPVINTLCLPFPIVIASSFNGTLRLTALGPEPVFREDDFKDFLQGTIKRLASLSIPSFTKYEINIRS